MKYFIYITLALFVASCDNRTKTVSDNSVADKPKTDTSATDRILSFSFVTKFSHQSISNKSDRQIDLLFNGIDNYLGGQPNHKVHFRTECLPCEPIQEFMGGLLFAKRLLIMTDQKLAVEKLINAQTKLEIIEGKNMPHIWPFLPVMKEAKSALDELIRIVNGRY